MLRAFRVLFLFKNGGRMPTAHDRHITWYMIFGSPHSVGARPNVSKAPRQRGQRKCVCSPRTPFSLVSTAPVACPCLSLLLSASSPARSKTKGRNMACSIQSVSAGVIRQCRRGARVLLASTGTLLRYLIEISQFNHSRSALKPRGKNYLRWNIQYRYS